MWSKEIDRYVGILDLNFKKDLAKKSIHTYIIAKVGIVATFFRQMPNNVVFSVSK